MAPATRPSTALGPGPLGASSGGAQERSDPTVILTDVTEPVWIVVRATAPLSAGGQLLLRDHVATVDATDAFIREQLIAGWLVPLPAAEQPALATDPETNGPVFATGAGELTTP